MQELMRRLGFAPFTEVGGLELWENRSLASGGIRVDVIGPLALVEAINFRKVVLVDDVVKTVVQIMGKETADKLISFSKH